MAMFVHLASESALSRIQRNGINRSRRGVRELPRSVFAVPVTRNFYISHQWLRELKGFGRGSMVGIYFRIPDDEQVWVGHYNQAHRLMSAAEAVAEFLKGENREGWEVLIPRRIEADEIHRTRILPQVVGWRYYPNAKGRLPCPCRFCSRGEYGSRSWRERLGVED